ncbi:dTMP kinase [Candidatus Woesearchaeota archaeon]|nr:dTMP kinase [Candidatus Woesearchaeota archaeon]
MKNLFIVFDGMDGCGKSTQVSLLHDYLFRKDKRIRILTTREPTFGRYGIRIRDMLSKHKNPYSDAEVLTELYVKDRQDHVDNLILPFLRKDTGNISMVLCDRYYYSTIAYQHAQGIPLNKLITMNKKFPRPDLAIILDLNPETAMHRITRERAVEKFEKLEFMNELRKNFHSLKDLLDDNIKIIDTSGSEEETFAKIKRRINRLLA